MMQEILEKIDKDSLPKHVAIIMDGNGRWRNLEEKKELLAIKVALLL